MAQVPPGQRPEAVDIAYTPSCSRGRGRERRKGGGNKRTGGAAREEARRPPHKAFPRRNACPSTIHPTRHDAPQAGAGFLACEDGGRCFPTPFKPSRMGAQSPGLRIGRHLQGDIRSAWHDSASGRDFQPRGQSGWHLGMWLEGGGTLGPCFLSSDCRTKCSTWRLTSRLYLNIFIFTEAAEAVLSPQKTTARPRLLCHTRAGSRQGPRANGSPRITRANQPRCPQPCPSRSQRCPHRHSGTSHQSTHPAYT